MASRSGPHGFRSVPPVLGASRREHRRGRNPRQAAARELLEESGQQPDEQLRFIGYARFVLAPDQRAEYLALYAGSSVEGRAFEPTEEISAIRWWDLLERLPGYVQPLDAYLAALTR
ncbi:NUDIX hydrolase [Streptomyces sp. MA15]|nr:NUDIX hydrolase [Streptomyces sp. MA15]MDN3271178.1 NUDIX hydrolase [Streptomyces sp. MA15]